MLDCTTRTLRSGPFSLQATNPLHPEPCEWTLCLWLGDNNEWPTDSPDFIESGNGYGECRLPRPDPDVSNVGPLVEGRSTPSPPWQMPQFAAAAASAAATAVLAFMMAKQLAAASGSTGLEELLSCVRQFVSDYTMCAHEDCDMNRHGSFVGRGSAVAAAVVAALRSPSMTGGRSFHILCGQVAPVWAEYIEAGSFPHSMHIGHAVLEILCDALQRGCSRVAASVLLSSFKMGVHMAAGTNDVEDEPSVSALVPPSVVEMATALVSRIIPGHSGGDPELQESFAMRGSTMDAARTAALLRLVDGESDDADGRVVVHHTVYAHLVQLFAVSVPRPTAHQHVARLVSAGHYSQAGRIARVLDVLDDTDNKRILTGMVSCTI